MTNHSFYPMDLSRVLQQRWQEAGHAPSSLPKNNQLFGLIDTAYQASLLREEDSPVQCRVIVSSPDDPELKEIEAADQPYVVQYLEQIKFSAHQIRKMAAAVGYYSIIDRCSARFRSRHQGKYLGDDCDWSGLGQSYGGHRA